MEQNLHFERAVSMPRLGRFEIAPTADAADLVQANCERAHRVDRSSMHDDRAKAIAFHADVVFGRQGERPCPTGVDAEGIDPRRAGEVALSGFSQWMGTAQAARVTPRQFADAARQAHSIMIDQSEAGVF
jgi:hypothetical protein